MAQKKPSLTSQQKTFIKTVMGHYKASGRHDLPWRKTDNPYKILVSEIMLQQTQVARVIPKYTEFLKLFPSVQRLAHAPLGEVLKAWQGLGYNRRAKFLWMAATHVAHECKGKWPDSHEGLCKLPGVGVYTAGAVMNFAYNQPVPLIETNIRTVYIHHFFADTEGVSDKELLPLIEQTLDRQNPREWNWALMDYGSFLKETVGNVNRQSKTYQKQTPFKESNRFVRGAIVKALAVNPQTSAGLLRVLAAIERERVEKQLDVLLSEGMVVVSKDTYKLP